MKEVVTAILKRSSDNKLLMLKRSATVRTFPNRWHFISGGLESNETTFFRANKEIEEETGLKCRKLTSGRPFIIENFVVHPFLFETNAHYVNLNWENQDYKWIDANEIPTGVDAVPALKLAYERAIAPLYFDQKLTLKLQEIENNRTHGAVELSKMAISAMLLPESSNLLDFAWALMVSRPSMAPIFNSVVSVLTTSQDTKIAIHNKLIEIEVEQERLAERLGIYISKFKKQVTIITLSLSSSVRNAILRNKKNVRQVVICESRPLFEGAQFSATLAQNGIHTVLITEAQMNCFVDKVDFGLVGADSITSHEECHLINKVGTTSLALACSFKKIPIIAVSSVDKISINSGEFEEMSTNEIYLPYTAELRAKLQQNELVEIRNVYFEATPISLFESILTSSGPLNVEEIQRITTDSQKYLYNVVYNRFTVNSTSGAIEEIAQYN